MITCTVYYRLYDPSGTRPKTVLKKNTFISAQDTAVGRIDTTNRIRINTVEGITKVIANCENCGETYDSSDVWVYADFGWTKFLPGSSVRPQGVGAVGSSQNKPLLIKFSVSIDPERQLKGSGEIFLLRHTANTDRMTVLADGTTMSVDGSSYGSQDYPPPAYEPPVDSKRSSRTIFQPNFVHYPVTGTWAFHEQIPGTNNDTWGQMSFSLVKGNTYSGSGYETLLNGSSGRALGKAERVYASQVVVQGRQFTGVWSRGVYQWDFSGTVARDGKTFRGTGAPKGGAPPFTARLFTLH